NLSIVRALVQASADVNCQSHMLPCTAMVAECSVAEISEFCAVTPLQMAVLQNSVDLAAYLLQEKADVNICSSHGVSALFIATRKCDLRCVKLLLHAGAEKDLSAEGSPTPMQIATGRVAEFMQNFHPAVPSAGRQETHADEQRVP
ncbi:unnamed protein product, partial [Symbiodinium sp. CCMP2456]